MTYLKIDGISKHYAAHTALKNVSFDVPEGKIFGLLGPNGAGKTSLIRIINQITAADEGQILLQNQVLSQDHLSRIGYLPEERGLYKKMKVLEQMLYFAGLRGFSKADSRKRALEWMERFGMQGWENKKIEELSKGMQQKVQFVITVLHEPDLIILDEPFSGFDPVNTQQIKEEILRLKADGKTVIFSTHRMESVEELCDHIGIIIKSEKKIEGNLSEVRQQYRNNRYEAIVTELPSAPLIKPEELHRLEDGFTKAIFVPENEAQAMKLMQQLASHTFVRSFRELVPSMQDIFVQLVEENHHE
jgi:ABC-2 type transport system ATP-binding protein